MLLGCSVEFITTFGIIFQDACKQVVDRYIEFDNTVIFLDALLHKPQAYRHILHNANVTVSIRLLLHSLLLHCYIRLLLPCYTSSVSCCTLNLNIQNSSRG